MMRRIPLQILLAVVISSSLAHGKNITFSTFDKNHSTIGFRVPIFGGFSEVEGKFTEFEVTVSYDPDSPTESSVRVVISAASVNTGIKDRDHHLMGPDFFHVVDFPEILFESSRIEQREAQLVAHGTLNMRGVSRAIELPFEIKGLHTDSESGKMMLGLAAGITIDRQDYGIAWRHPEGIFVGDEVRIEIKLISRMTEADPEEEE